MLVCLEKTPRVCFWLVLVVLLSFALIAASVGVQAKFGPFAMLPPLTTDEERANTLTDYYRNPAARINLIGSSLSYLLKQPYFDLEGVRYIAMSGTSALTGMRIVASQTVLPRVL